MLDVQKPRKSRKWDPTLLALKHFCQVLDQDTNPDSIRAAIYYLCDRYLHMKLWGRRDWE